MTVSISRNPFAREDVIREVVKTTCTCQWCGQKRHKKGQPIDGLFAYGVENDNGRQSIDYRHLFCSVGCFRAYNG